MKPTSKEFVDFFPLSDEDGSPTIGINTSGMQELAKSSEEITESEFESILKKHDIFIKNGGKYGSWQTLLVAEYVLGIYFGVKVEDGEQANLFERKVDKFDFCNKNLAAANFIGSIGDNVNASASDFENAIFTDASWKNANFEGSNLSKVDFSRGDFSNCNFKNCNLRNTDFENCNLTGADFRGADTTDSRFPGAILENVKF